MITTTAPNQVTAASVPELMSVNALAARWNVKADTIRAWARRGEIPAVKLGRLTLFRPSDLLAFLVPAPVGRVPAGGRKAP